MTENEKHHDIDQSVASFAKSQNDSMACLERKSAAVREAS